MSTDAGLLGPLHVPAAHLLVVDRLRRIIALGEVLPGEQLPSERLMAEQFGVSRLTVREALVLLRGEGLIESRRGTRGGPIVLENRLSLRSRRRRLVEFAAEMRINHEYRQAVEPMAAQLAASRSAAGDIAAMRSANEAIRGSTSVAEFRRADSAFHLAVASASANPRIRRAVEDARSEMFMAFDAQDFVVLQQASADAHETIVAAIEAQDAERAAALMTTHLVAAWAEIDAVLAERVADA